jgi:hypothetical protein
MDIGIGQRDAASPTPAPEKTSASTGKSPS